MARQLPKRPSTPPRLDPGTVTAMTAQVHDPESVNLSIDGEFAFGIRAEIVAKAGIRVGDTLSESQIRELWALQEHAKATDTALRALASRPRSEYEIQQRLRQRGFSEEAIAAAIHRLREWRYLDDDAFATFWVENRAANRPRGRRLIEQELRQKGVDRQIVADTLDATDLDEQASALKLAQSRTGSMAALDPDTRRRRLVGLLTRRGYSYETIRAVLNQLRESENADDEPFDDA